MPAAFIWKMAGETDLPSINDQITTGTAGALLGESLFRMASLLLEDGGPHPDFGTSWGQVCFPRRSVSIAWCSATGSAPSNSELRTPRFFQRLTFGVSADANVTMNGQKVPDKQEAIADYALAYGLPGKDGYEYLRPFDYFSFEFAGQTSAHGHNFHQDIFIRGMLYGTDYDLGDNYRGIVGIFWQLRLRVPQIFRVSSTALSFGTTEQWWLTRRIAVQGTALGGLGFAGAGTIPTRTGCATTIMGDPPRTVSAAHDFRPAGHVRSDGARILRQRTGSDDKRGSSRSFGPTPASRSGCSGTRPSGSISSNPIGMASTFGRPIKTLRGQVQPGLHPAGRTRLRRGKVGPKTVRQARIERPMPAAGAGPPIFVGGPGTSGLPLAAPLPPSGGMSKSLLASSSA